ncbi:RusA family crossover junction endodeoxyribonuclease [Streptomyces sp. NPDC048179]|uniref:RusA family crossover junction endodeoxyribonuclease n=1 Tax=Streptomyces sp. NPDC048179 TaxID=3365506 RepID=UPI00372301FA
MTVTLPTATDDPRPVIPAPAFSLVVFGTPGPQGSKKPVGTRRSKKGNVVPILVESSAKVKPWREAVHYAAERLITGRTGYVKLDGPLVAEMHFTLPAPARMPKDRVAHTVYPDLSKLLRSTEDALTTAGVWADDARVIRYRDLSKTYPNLGPRSLPVPGAIIRIWRDQPGLGGYALLVPTP